MTRGIRVIWPDENGKIDEIEYFCGIDVDNLDGIPPLVSVRAIWPRYQGGTAVEYRIDVRCEPASGGRVNLVVDYDPARNRALIDQYGDVFHWGTNTIVLRRGHHSGSCAWSRSDSVRPEQVPWESSIWRTLPDGLLRSTSGHDGIRSSGA